MRLVAGIALTVVACVLGAGPAIAHDDLVGATPEDGAVLTTAPATIVLEFFEPVGSVSPTLTLLDDHEVPVQALEPTVVDRTVTGALPADLTDGTYAVRWSVDSDDGHEAQGVTRFAIGAPTTSMDYRGVENGGASRTPLILIGSVLAGGTALAVLVRRRRLR